MLAIENAMTSRITDVSDDVDGDPVADADGNSRTRPESGHVLSDVIRDEVLPRLLLAHAAGTHDPTGASDQTNGHVALSQVVVELADLSVAQDLPAALALVESVLASGVSIDRVLLDAVGPAARRLGDQWLDDERSFADVSLGLAVIQRVVSMLRHRVRPPTAQHGVVVLGAAPNEQHRLGLQILADLLRLAGWDTRYLPDASMEELCAVISTEPVVMLGLTVSSDELAAPLGRWIPKIKKRALNRDLAIMLGGAMDLSESARKLGVVTRRDPRQVIAWLRREGTISI